MRDENEFSGEGTVHFGNINFGKVQFEVFKKPVKLSPSYREFNVQIRWIGKKVLVHTFFTN